MYLISVYFDEKSNKVLQRYIDQIAAVTGNAFMTDHTVPPHMTISAIEARSVEVLRPSFKELMYSEKKQEDEKQNGGEIKPRNGKIQIVYPGQLLPYVFFVGPVLNNYLSEISEIIYNQFKDIPETTISRFYRPGSWMPHITLGKTLTSEQMQQAFKIIQENFQPFEATVTEIGLAKVNPHEDVERYKLWD